MLDRGCARAVKGMKIEAAEEVASGEVDSAVTIRVMSGTDRETGSWSRLTVP